MGYKDVNRINGIAVGMATRIAELERELFMLKNSQVEASDKKIVASPLINVAIKLTVKDILEKTRWYVTLKFDEKGANYTFEKWMIERVDRYFKDDENGIFKFIDYQDFILLVGPSMQKQYDIELNEKKMEYVRSHKED